MAVADVVQRFEERFRCRLDFLNRLTIEYREYNLRHGDYLTFDQVVYLLTVSRTWI